MFHMKHSYRFLVKLKCPIYLKFWYNKNIHYADKDNTMRVKES